MFLMLPSFPQTVDIVQLCDFHQSFTCKVILFHMLIILIYIYRIANELRIPSSSPQAFGFRLLVICSYPLPIFHYDFSFSYWFEDFLCRNKVLVPWYFYTLQTSSPQKLNTNTFLVFLSLNRNPQFCRIQSSFFLCFLPLKLFIEIQEFFPTPSSQRHALTFSFIDFIILLFTFWSLNHEGSSFASDMRQGSCFVLSWFHIVSYLSFRQSITLILQGKYGQNCSTLIWFHRISSVIHRNNLSTLSQGNGP